MQGGAQAFLPRHSFGCSEAQIAAIVRGKLAARTHTVNMKLNKGPLFQIQRHRNLLHGAQIRASIFSKLKQPRRIA